MVVGVGEPGDPGVDFRSLAGLLPLVVLSPDRRNEFWRDSPVPRKQRRKVNTEYSWWSKSCNIVSGRL